MIQLTQTAQIGEATVAWDRWGPAEGTPLLLVHGFSGSAHDFALRIPELAASRPVIALDHRGHGLSTKFERSDAYSIDILTDDLLALVDNHVDEPFDLLGHSMGGRIAIQLSLARPELVRSLILMDTTSGRIIVDDGVGQFFEAFDPASESLDLDSFETAETPLIAAAVSDEWQAIKELRSAAFDPYAMKALGLTLFSPDLEPLTDRLGEIDCAVTVFAGEHDHPFVDHLNEIAEASGGTARVIESAYHSPQLTHPAQWLEIVEAHLDAVD